MPDDVKTDLGNGLFCVAWGQLTNRGHMDCPVVVTYPGQVISELRDRLKDKMPVICDCDCTTCDRAWWAKGRPTLREDGKVVDENGKVLT